MQSQQQGFINKAVNIIGQIRLYSLVDLMLFIYVIGASGMEAAGIILLHISFLFYLEYTHKHTYRLAIPKYFWVIGGAAGVILYAKLAVVGFVVASMLYVRKNRSPFSFLAPLARGCQYYFLAAGILGWVNPVPFLAFVLMAMRNFAGDLRDITKDKKENMKTLPIVLGLDRDYKKIYLLVLFSTSFVWWHISNLPAAWLLGIYLIQIFTYNLTPRK